MKHINYCLPIINSLQSEVLATVRNSLEHYQYVEVWLDYVDGIDDTFVKQLVTLPGPQLILVFRRQNLEATQMHRAQRLDILNMLSDTLVLVDLDVHTQITELDHIRQSALAISTIVSYHNYQLTPDDKQLRTIIATMETYRPTIYKLSAMCTTAQDGLRLLQLLLALKAKNRRAIVLGMGEFGLITRLFGTLWGNELLFAPQIASEHSAPGQLTRSQLEIIFKQLGQ